MGLDLDSPGGRDTLRRWVGALWDMTEGYDGDPKMSTLFPVECPVCPDEEKTHIVEGPIRFTGLCEHHVLPIRGSVWVGYLETPYEELNLEQPWEQLNIEHELTRKGIRKFVSDYKATLRKAS